MLLVLERRGKKGEGDGLVEGGRPQGKAKQRKKRGSKKEGDLLVFKPSRALPEGRHESKGPGGGKGRTRNRVREKHWTDQS